MGRLFWKFLLFFFLAQLTSVVGVGLSIWWQAKQAEAFRADIEASRPARDAVDAAASTLQYGGKESLIKLLQKWQKSRMPQVYAVDETGQEIMHRNYSTKAFDSASRVARQNVLSSVAQNIELPGGQKFLLFVPESGARGFNGRQPPPPEFRPPLIESGLEFLGLAPRPPGGDMQRKFRMIYPVKPLLAGALASLIFAAILAWYFSKPIKNLRHAFQQASEGNLDIRVSKNMGGRRDELSDLGRDFDAMAARLSSLLQGQTRLLHHVSHELRSPLARIQMALGLAEQNDKNIESTLKRVELEASRMDKMVGELLELSRLESGVVHLKKEAVDLIDLLTTLLEDAAFEAKSKQLVLSSQMPKQLIIVAQSDLLYRAIENVMRNAIKYTPESSEISLICQEIRSENAVNITINDQGNGVAESELNDIFKPFIRGSQGSQTVGHGVGLAIAKQIIEAHGGKVFAKNLKPVGFSVEITLPYKS